MAKNKIINIWLDDSCGWVDIRRKSGVHSYELDGNRFARILFMQRRMIDPRSPEQVAMDDHDSDTRETIESIRPY